MPKTTKNQNKAILADGKNILVSASAGSGKTFVMIERIIRLITEEGVDVSSILAVTYTNLAASEMKQKLIKAVLKRIGEGKDVEQMRKTLAEIPTADISTFHSFCLNLLRTYFYAAGVDPDFSIADSAKDKELSLIAINSVFNDLYEKQDEEFLKLVRIYRRYRGDSSLKEEIFSLYQKSISESNPIEFLQNCVLAISEENYCEYERFLLDVLKKKTLGKAFKYKEIKEKLESFKGTKDGDGLIASLEDAMVKVNSVATAKDFNDFLFKSAVSTLSVRTKCEDEDFVEVKNQLSKFKNDLATFYRAAKKLIPPSREEDLKKYLQTKEIISALVNIIELFDVKYSQLKDKEGVLTFADLEHKTLNLLRKDSAILEGVKSKYKYIFADEYQDVNGVQEEILNLISNDNLFMVGDVKQSIYAFRGCNPEIFAGKYDRYLSTGEGESIPLENNFRSTDEVLAAVNNVFERVMTKEHGGVEYSLNKMVGGGAYSVGDGDAILHVINVEKPDKQLIDQLYNLYEDATSKEEDEDFYEGSLVANIIEEELKKEIYDVSLGKKRKVELSDIAVLTRNSSGFTDEIVKWLIREGIPVVSESKADILKYPEIKLLLSILKLINFYADDAPLAATLKSAVGKITEEELAEIRREGLVGASPKDKPTFLECVEKYKVSGPNKILKQKLLDFEKYFNKLRVYAEFLGAGEILAKVLRETGLDLEIAGRSLGKIRTARVERLIAETTPSGKKLSVSEFLQRIENSGESVSVSEVAGSDAVKVVSMHSSKGLEYPIVILAGLFKGFNDIDDKQQILFSRKNGIATYHYDEETKIRSTTLARTVFKQKSSIERANEEARVFYVAMTRAKVRLHLITTKEVQKEKSEYAYLFTDSFTDFLTLSDMTVKNYKSTDLVKGKSQDLNIVEIGKGRDSLKQKIIQNLTFKYPHLSDISLPLKSSVTEVNGRHNEKTLYENKGKKFDKPYLKEEDRVSKAKEGTAYHHFLELCDLRQKNADKQLIDLLSSGKLTKEEADLLNLEQLNKILSYPLWERLGDYKLYKEQPFLVSFTARELYGEDSDAEILVQGIIDLLAVKDGKVILVDYKRSNHSAEQLKKDYQMQLYLYKKAIEKGLKLTVEKTYILSVETGELVEM